MMSPRSLVLAAFAADSLALGPHWIYDPAEIARHFPAGVTTLSAPRSDYHPGKAAGDLTHFGDQTLVLLESLAAHGWSEETWRADWRAFWESGPVSYRDRATRDTLANLAAGRREPSDSNDLGGAARIAPVLAAMPGLPLAMQLAAVRGQTAVTHGDPAVIDAAEFFALAVGHVAAGADFATAFEEAATSNAAVSALEAARASLSEPEEVAAARLGLSCPWAKAWPLTLATALRHEADAALLLRRNAELGGNSAARGAFLGMLVAAAGRFDELPVEWTAGLRARDRIDAALAVLAPESASPEPSSHA